MRRLLPSIACLALAALIGCGKEETIDLEPPPRQPKPKPKPPEPLTWKELPPLPEPLGVGGPFAGTSHGALLVAGGAHFPVSLFEGGQKVWVDGIWVLEPGEPAWLTGFRLDRPLAYGASVSTRDGFYLLGGCDAERCYADCRLLRWVGGTVKQEALPPLPSPCAMTSAALVGSTLYVAGGQDSTRPTAALKNFWALELDDESGAWRTLKPWPGPARILAVAGARGRSFYLFSGAELIAGDEGGTQRRYLTDAYRYDPGIGWARVADLPRAAVAAPCPAMRLGANRILIFGGDDGAHADRLMELKDEHPGFPRSILAYDAEADAWSTLGEMPAAHVTTPLVYWRGMHVIASGEIRPGVRSPKVYGVKPTD